MNSNEHSEISKNFSGDPRLTAYALGEMDAAERAAFETEIRDNPAAHAAIADIRSTAGQIESALAAETLTQTAAAPAATGQPAHAEEYDWRATCEAEARRARDESAVRRRRDYRFPYFLVAGIAVACFAILFFMMPRPETQRAQTGIATTETPGGTTVINGKTYASVPLETEPARAPEPAPLPAVAANAPVDDSGVAQSFTTGSAFAAAPKPLIDVQTSIAHMPVSKDGLSHWSAPGRISPAGENSTGSALAKSDFLYALGALQNGVHLNFDATANSAPDTLVIGGDIGGAIAGYLSDDRASSLKTFHANSSARSGVVYVGGRGGAVYSNSDQPLSAASGYTSEYTFGRSSPAPGAESYAQPPENQFQRVAENPLSTFSVDVDTASYTNIRRFLNGGRLPPRDAVRIEEMVNYFSYDYAPPAKENTAPFAATMEVAAAPWNPAHKLVRIGIKGRELDNATRPSANIVFLIDVSGSMDSPNKLPLVKESMRMLIGKLRADDHIAIVTYANSIDMPLVSTPVFQKDKIFKALDGLRAAGGTNGGAGIQLAYEIARANFIKDGANRVILCTDGDFNIGVTDRGELTRMIEEKAKSGVFLTVLGFGMGNYKDATLQTLADKGNGNHGYIDTRDEARRLLVEQTTSTLVTIAKDVKLQVEFNPAQAAAYRLIGYENRMLAKEDFNNDKVDAGEIGAGHTVTALYEVVPAHVVKDDAEAALREAVAAAAPPPDDPLKYQTQTIVTYTPQPGLGGELLTLKIRYKEPASDVSEKLEFALADKSVAFADASADFKFASAVAGFGMVLRNSTARGLASYDSVLAWAEAGVTASNDPEGRRAEFTDLVRRAKQLAAK